MGANGKTRHCDIVSYRQLTQQIRLRKKIASFLRVLRTDEGFFTD